jgi:hypothetical protein
VTASNHVLREAGQSPGVGGAPRALPRGRARQTDAPGGEKPPSFPAEDQVVKLALHHAFVSGTSRLQLPIPLRGLSPHWRAEGSPLNPWRKLSQGGAISLL